MKKNNKSFFEDYTDPLETGKEQMKERKGNRYLMKVKELIKKLESYNQDFEVKVFSYDSDAKIKGVEYYSGIEELEPDDEYILIWGE